jgi:hypothetical protein
MGILVRHLKLVDIKGVFNYGIDVPNPRTILSNIPNRFWCKYTHDLRKKESQDNCTKYFKPIINYSVAN